MTGRLSFINERSECLHFSSLGRSLSSLVCLSVTFTANALFHAPFGRYYTKKGSRLAALLCWLQVRFSRTFPRGGELNVRETLPGFPSHSLPSRFLAFSFAFGDIIAQKRTGLFSSRQVLRPEIRCAKIKPLLKGEFL